jgi:putative NIF3 family GTP cyclohydrolase 1 type 2
VIVTGEVRHHDALAASARGATVVMTLHSRSERPALAALCARLGAEVPGLSVAVSTRDEDPLRFA